MGQNWQKERIIQSRAYQLKAYDEVNELVFKERNGKLVTLIDGTQLVEFVSCSYLGLDTDPRIISAVNKNIKKFGITFAAARTRIKAESFDVLDNMLNEVFCNAHSTVFSSLHLAHLGFFPLLGSGELPSFPAGENGFLFILDKTVHSSIQINRAMLEQFGSVSLVDFHKINHVKEKAKLARSEKKAPVFIADSIGSMGGIAPIKSLFHIAEEYDGYIYLDDAHGTSVFGKNGCGCVLEELEYSFHPRLILTASLAKAFGTAGGGVLVLPTKDDAILVYNSLYNVSY